MGGEKGVDGADGGELVGPVGEGIAGGGAVDSKGGRAAAGETRVRVAAELAVVVDGGRWWRRRPVGFIPGCDGRLSLF